MKNLPYIATTGKATFVHASLHEPKHFHYLLSFEEAEPSFRLLKTTICVFGHTHLPTCFEEVARSARMLPPGTLEMEPGRRYILNPGSVGQPRDRDPRLAFGILDDEAMTFEVVRLHYDNQRTARKIRTAGLPAYLADRLL
jgi:diadenosine tetraphosphatase ApaH/serine/threonine PP2A family protein phosphatase